MSTTINVTVDDGGLPARNRQQTAANRQALVQGQASQQAAQRGADQRAADRRAASLDPTTGRPLTSAGASSRLSRIQQEPAANRRANDIPFFYIKATQATDTDPPSIQVVSGSGNQAATHVFQYKTASALGYELAGDYEPTIGPWSSPAIWDEGPDYYSGFRQTALDEDGDIERTETYNSSRYIEAQDYSQLFCFPLGDGTALVVLYRQMPLFVWRDDYYESFVITDLRPAEYSDTLEAFSYTSEILRELEVFTEYAAFRVGMNIAQQVQVSNALLDKISSVFYAWQVETDTNTITPTCSPLVTTCIGYGGSASADVYFMAQQLQGELEVSLQFGQLSFSGNLSMPAMAYGISDRATYLGVVAATPMSWFAIDDPDNLATLIGAGDYFGDLQYATHQQILELPYSAPSLKVRDILPPSKILGLPTNRLSFSGAIRSMTAADSMYKWADGSNYMEGVADWYIDAFQYPYETSDNYWLGSGPKFKAGLSSLAFESFDVDTDADWKRAFIYDWGQKGFCLQQASAYGLSNLTA